MSATHALHDHTHRGDLCLKLGMVIGDMDTLLSVTWLNPVDTPKHPNLNLTDIQPYLTARRIP